MLNIEPKVHSWLRQKGKITATLTPNLMLFSECLKLSFPTNVVFEIPHALEYIREKQYHRMGRISGSSPIAF